MCVKGGQCFLPKLFIHFRILLLLCPKSNLHTKTVWTIIMTVMNIYRLVNRQISLQSMLMTISSAAEDNITTFSLGPADLHGWLPNPAAHCWVGETPSARHSISLYQKHSTHCSSSSSSFSTPVLNPFSDISIKLLEMRMYLLLVHNNKTCDMLLSNGERAHSLAMFSKIYTFILFFFLNE